MKKPDILLHICCGPCACYPVQRFKEQNLNVLGFWYNPNIHPKEEYRLRRLTALDFCRQTGIAFAEQPSGPLCEWMESTRPGWLTGNKGLRCRECWKNRIMHAASYAARAKISAFTTTLLYSRHQDHEMIRVLCKQAADTYNIEFRYEDFRKGWKEGISLSRKLNLYRQRYCGCLFSLDERDLPDKQIDHQSEDDHDLQNKEQ